MVVTVKTIDMLSISMLRWLTMTLKQKNKIENISHIQEKTGKHDKNRLRFHPIIKLHKISFILEKRIDRMLNEDLDLTFSQFMVLKGIQYKADITQKDIARFRNCTEASVSRIIQSLLEKGFISRIENQENRRENILELTKGGIQKVTSAEVLVHLELDRALHVIKPAERKQFERNIDQLLYIFNQNIDLSAKK